MPKFRRKHVRRANAAPRPGPMPKAWQRAAREVRMYPVYARHISDRVLEGEEPVLFLDGETREQWLADGSARAMMRGKALRLMINLPPRVQRSMSMGPSVIEGNAAGKGFAMALCRAWMPAARVMPMEAVA